MSTTIPQKLEPLRLDKTTVLPNDRRNTLPRLKQTAQEFEAMLYQMMFKSMRETVQKNPMFHGGSTEDTFQEMADLEISKSIASSRSFGLADAIIRDFRKFVRDPGAAKNPADGATGDQTTTSGQTKKAEEASSKLRALETKARAAQFGTPDAARIFPSHLEGNVQPSIVNARPVAAAKKAYASAVK